MATPFMLLIVTALSPAVFPLGVPPLPPDAAIAAVAPEQCLFYASWAGSGRLDPASPNRTERLLADPEIHQFLEHVQDWLEAEIGGSPRRARGGEKRPDPNAEEDQSGANAIELAKILLQSPVALFVEDIKGDFENLDVRGGLLARLDDKAQRAADLLRALQKELPPKAVEEVTIAGRTYSRIQPPDGPAIFWRIEEKYLVAGVGEGSAEGILKRMAGKPPAWLTAIDAQLPIQRRTSVAYFNLKAFLERLGERDLPPRARKALAALGIDQITTVTAACGLEGEGFVNRVAINFPGQPRGLLTLAAARPLAPADLAAIPRDSAWALAARIDPAQVFQAVQETAAQIDPAASAAIAAGMAELKAELGFDLRADVIEALGDTWATYDSPGENGVYVTGMAAVVSIKDRAKLVKVHDLLLKQAREVLAARGEDSDEDRPWMRHGKASIDEIKFAGQTIYRWNSGGDYRLFPLPTAWCLTERELIVAFMPQAIKAYLTRDKDYQSLAAAPEVAAALAGPNKPVALAYVNTPELVRTYYSLMQLGLCMIAQFERGDGFPFDFTKLPSVAALNRHLRPEVITLRRTATGIECSSAQTIPGGSLGALAAIAAAGAVAHERPSPRPVVREAPAANNLRQVALAILRYAADNNDTLPPAYVADAAGKPLLSWRVMILPYLDKGGLYQQFHLDEPWDSQHNKTLIDKIPAVYHAAADKKLEGGKTNCLTIRGPSSVFRGTEGVRTADIADGASNTILLVEAANESAVVWTKPDDFVPDPKNPIKGLVGLRPGGFMAATADGAVRQVPATIRQEMLQRLFDRADGQTVDWTEIEPPRPAGKGKPGEKAKAGAKTPVKKSATFRKEIF